MRVTRTLRKLNVSVSAGPRRRRINTSVKIHRGGVKLVRKAIRGIFNFTDSIAGKIKMIAQIRVANSTNGVCVAVFRCIGGLIN